MKMPPQCCPRDDRAAHQTDGRSRLLHAAVDDALPDKDRGDHPGQSPRRSRSVKSASALLIGGAICRLPGPRLSGQRQIDHGYDLLLHDHVLQIDRRVDLDFLVSSCLKFVGLGLAVSMVATSRAGSRARVIY
jgi:hypothetical protein